MLILLLLLLTLLPSPSRTGGLPGPGPDAGRAPQGGTPTCSTLPELAESCPSVSAIGLGASTGPVLWANQSAAQGGPQPAARCCSSMAFDVKDGYSVLVGGSGGCMNACNRTWVDRAGTWSELPSAPAPSPREWASLCYDPFSGALVLFGGLDPNGSAPLSDTWTFSAGTWTPVPTPTAPMARWGAGLAPDLQDGYLVLFGGYNPGAGFLQDTWAFVNGTWQQVLPAVSPPARWTPAMSFDPEQAAVVLFGGYSGTVGFLGDTWTYAGGNWQQLPLGLSPPVREKAMMEYDAADQALVLFGGDNCPLGCGRGLYTRLLNDTWTFAHGGWTNATAAFSPRQQCCGAMSYDWTTGQVVLLSYNGTRATSASTWVATLAPPPTGRPSLTAFEAMPFAPTAGTPTTFLVEARPSQGHLSYSYQDLPPGCTPADMAMITCVIPSAGTYSASVTVADGSGANDSIGLTLTVTWGTHPLPPPPPGPDVVPWVVGATGVVVVAVAVLLLVRRRHRDRGRPLTSRRKGAAPSAAPPASEAAPPSRSTGDPTGEHDPSPTPAEAPDRTQEHDDGPTER